MLWNFHISGDIYNGTDYFMTARSMSVRNANRENPTIGKSSVSCPLKPSDSAPLKHSTMPP